jgi:hypothetical protein
MTFRDFVEQSLSDFETQLRREELEPATIEMRLRGARQFAQLFLGGPQNRGGPQRKGESQSQGGDPSTRRFGGPR